MIAKNELVLAPRVEPAATALLRVITGVVIAAHGVMKLMDFAAWQRMVDHLGLPAPEIMSRLGLAAELGGGVLLVLGLLTPLAALAILVEMIVAIVTVHLSHGLFAQNGGFEYPLILAAISFFFVLRGAGAYSVDAMLERGVRRRRAPEIHPGIEPMGGPA